jgi:hypothetical protein
VAGELPHYSQWIREQVCAACAGPAPCDPHHALSGTTYSPEEPTPAKAIPNARKGQRQRAHDFFLISLHTRCHSQFHAGRGWAAGKSPAERDRWEQEQVADHRRRYTREFPNGAPKTGATSDRASKSRKRIGAGWTVATIRDWLRKEAPTRPAPVAAALGELADLIERDTL